MRSCDWHFIFPYCPAIVQILISLVKLHHEMRLIAFMLYQMRLFFDLLMYFKLPNSVCTLLKINFHVLLSFLRQYEYIVD